MTTLRAYTLRALLAPLVFWGCDDLGSQPIVGDLTSVEMAELTVVEDPEALDAPVELADATVDVATGLGGSASIEARELAVQARAHGAAAGEFLRAGDRRRALDEAREARRLAAMALVAAGGEEAVEALIERIEELAVTIGDDDDDVFDDPEALVARLDDLAVEARELLAGGHLVVAAARALLGEQIVRLRRGHRDHRGDVRPERARLAVALAHTAVRLAHRLLQDDAAPVDAARSSDRRNRWLALAERMLAKAEEALTAGRYARAAHLAQHAHWAALKAVILPGGMVHEEIEAIRVLAHRLYEEASATVGDDPTELQARLLRHARRLIEIGEEGLAEGNPRGVAPLWSSAVISLWLIG